MADAGDRWIPAQLCTRDCLEHHDVMSDRHVNRAKEAIPKEYHVDYDDKQADKIFDVLVESFEEIHVTT